MTAGRYGAALKVFDACARFPLPPAVFRGDRLRASETEGSAHPDQERAKLENAGPEWTKSYLELLKVSFAIARNSALVLVLRKPSRSVCVAVSVSMECRTLRNCQMLCISSSSKSSSW